MRSLKYKLLPAAIAEAALFSYFLISFTQNSNCTSPCHQMSYQRQRCYPLRLCRIVDKVYRSWHINLFLILVDYTS